MGNGWSKDVASDVMRGTVATALSGAQALVAALPLGDAVVALGKQLHTHLQHFKDNDTNAVLLARRIAALTETVELAVKHIGADKDKLPQSLVAVMETLVQATGLITALKNEVVYRKLAKAGAIVKEFAAIEESLVSNIADLNALLSAEGLEQTSRCCDKILQALTSESVSIEQVRAAQTASALQFDQLLSQLKNTETGCDVAESRRLVEKMAKSLACSAADVKTSLQDICGELGGKLDTLLSTLETQFNGVNANIDGHANAMHARLDDHSVNQAGLHIKVDQLLGEKKKSDQRLKNHMDIQVF
jgi:hypothetical protein